MARRGAVAACITLVAILAAGCGAGSTAGSASKFCQTFRELNARPGSILNGLGPAPSTFGPSTTTASVLPVFRRVAAVLAQVDQDAPGAVKPDVNAVKPLFDSLVVDLARTSTISELAAYEASHPPLSPAGVQKAVAAEQHLSAYLKNTCHAKITSS